MTNKIHSDDDRPIDDEDDSVDEYSIEYGQHLFQKALSARTNDTTAQYTRFLNETKTDPKMKKTVDAPKDSAAHEEGAMHSPVPLDLWMEAAGIDKGEFEKSLNEEMDDKEQSRDAFYAIGEKDGRLLAQVFGNPNELPNLDAYLVSAVQYCRDRVPLPEPGTDDEEISIADMKDTVTVVATENGLAYGVGDEPLSEDEELAYQQRMRESEARKPEEQKYDIVNKSHHYNSHPSGVECIELAEKMTFNLGNAFKYVFRRNEKASSWLDLQKAEYYLKREIARIKQMITVLPRNTVVYLHPMMTISDMGKVRAITLTEPSSDALEFYSHLLTNPLIDEAVYNLERAHAALKHLLIAADPENAVS